MAFWCSRGCCVLVVFCQHSRRIIEGNQGRLPFFRQLFCHAVGTNSVAVLAFLGAIWAHFWVPDVPRGSPGGHFRALFGALVSFLAQSTIRRYPCGAPASCLAGCCALSVQCWMGLTAARLPGSRFRHPLRILLCMTSSSSVGSAKK